MRLLVLSLSLLPLQCSFSGRSPYKGTWEGERGSLLRAVAFWPLYKSLSPKAPLPVACCVWKREARALRSCSRNPYAMETPAAAGI